MLNQVIIVGRVIDISKNCEPNCSIITIGIKNNDDKTIPVSIYIKGNLINTIDVNLSVKDLVGVKGHFSLHAGGYAVIEGDKFTFLSAGRDKW